MPFGEDAFEGCSSLETINIPNSLTSIGSSAFAECSSLETITIPNSVTSIGYSAFGDCTNLTSIIFNNTSGWSASDEYDDEMVVSSIDVSNSFQNVTLFTDTYLYYNFTRSQ